MHLGNKYFWLDDNQKSIPFYASETGTQNISMSDVYLQEKGTYDKTIIKTFFYSIHLRQVKKTWARLTYGFRKRVLMTRRYSPFYTMHLRKCGKTWARLKYAFGK